MGRSRSAARSRSSSGMMAQRAADHVEGRACGVPGAGAGEALGEGGGVEVVHRGREEHGVPAVGDLGRERDVLRPLRAQVDRDLGPVRVQDRAQRLAQARARPAAGAGSACRRR